MWTDNRNHLLDSILVDFLIVVAAQLIGVPPSQFIAIVAFTQLSESFQHSNLKLWFGPLARDCGSARVFTACITASVLGMRTFWVRNTPLGDTTFGVLLPWWDMLFGTANFELRYDATGVRDQVEQGRDYGAGFWAQQWLGLKRLAGKA